MFLHQMENSLFLSFFTIVSLGTTLSNYYYYLDIFTQDSLFSAVGSVINEGPANQSPNYI